MPTLLAIVGPTASGKTPLSLILANRLAAEIVSADSRQVYRLLNIGTAKPTKEEQSRIPHHFVDILEPSEDYNAGRYGVEARQKIVELFRSGKRPILVGGSGLYVRAVIDGFFEGPGKDPHIRAQLEERLEKEGPEPLLAELRAVDPSAADRMELRKPRRIVRALEVYAATGKPISIYHQEQSSSPTFNVVQFALAGRRESLYRQIEHRVDSMLTDGLIEEVKSLQNRGYDRSLNSLNTVGYKEVFDFLEGKTTYEQMTELIKRNTRRFAKRQLTWFRADDRIHWIDADENTPLDEIAAIVEHRYRQESS
jgi:tRNA dimethylallyltransferase